MNRTYIISILTLFLLCCSLSLKATGLACDFIYINGEKWVLMEKPIYADSALYNRLNNFLPEKRSISTANWDGYTAFWIIKDRQLYLQKIEVDVYNKEKNEEYHVNFNADNLKKVFAPYYVPNGIHAKWFSGEIRTGRGKIIRYVHSGFDRNMEEECVIKIKKGKITRHHQYRNYKKAGVNLKDVNAELTSRFPFHLFPEIKNRKTIFFLSNFKMHPDGHFIDCHVIAYLHDKTKKMIEKQRHPIIRAFKRAMKTVYPWTIFYINGKYTMEFQNFTIPLIVRKGKT